MRPSVTRRITRPPIAFNMTPMIDVVFLLIVFFMLVSTFASAENVPMDLPEPEHSKAINVKLTDRVVINCVPAVPAAPATGGVIYQLGPLRVASLDELANRLAAAKNMNPRLQVVLRADKRLPYRSVREVMKVVAINQIEVMNLVAHVGDGAVER